MEIAENFEKISKGRQSLTEALAELDLAKKAFESSDQIKGRLERNSKEMNDIRTSMLQMMTISYFNSRMEELMSSFEKSMHLKFDEFSSLYFSQLNSKVSSEDLESQLNKRVG